MKKSVTACLAALGTAFLFSLSAGSVLAQDQVTDDDAAYEEEVHVTARKMEESIQEVPVAVTAIGAEVIENLQITSLQDISKITAGLIFDSEFGRGSNRPVIRGQANILGASGVSYFIDGVYISGSIDDYDLNDVERVEVVKGPQSALYGRNTYSGAINIITKSPSDEFSGRAKMEVAQDDQYEISASVSGPIGENWAGGLTARHYELGSPHTNTYDGSDIGKEESNSISGVLDWAASEKLDARFRVYWAETEDGQGVQVGTLADDNNCFFDNGALYGGTGRYYCGVIEPAPINSDWKFQAPRAENGRDLLQLSLSLDYEINDSWSVTSITGYNERDEIFITEADYGPTSFQTANFTPGGFPFAGFPVPPFGYGWIPSVVDFTFAGADEINDISQELRFQFSGERVNALFGYYYFDQSNDGRDIRELPPGAQEMANANFAAESAAEAARCAANPICAYTVPFGGPGIVVSRDQNNLNIKNSAIFGMVNFSLTEAVGLTLEGRYQDEEIDQMVIIQDLGSPIDEISTSSASFSSFSPRVTLDWQYNDNSMVYLLYAEGTKPGGFNSPVAIEAGLPTFDEEEVDSIELGWKNRWLNDQLTANFSYFMNEITGYQLTQNARSGSNTTSATVNAGDADVNGFEAELMFRPNAVEGLTLTFNWATVDPEFTRGVDANEGVLNDVADDNLVNCSTGNQFPDISGCTSLYGSIVGKQIPRTAENQYYLDADYRMPIGSGWEFFIGANYSHEDSKFSQVHNYAETGDADLVNARVGWSNDDYTVTLWGRNLTGEDSTPLVLRYADGNGSFRRNFAVTPRRDTYWGVSFIASF